MKILLLLPCLCYCVMVSEVSQYGITWTFDQAYESGQYANGDYWVQGPVVITTVSPDFDNTHHGWEVNPDHISDQGFDTRISGFDAARVPTLPYTAQPGQSVPWLPRVYLASRQCTASSPRSLLCTRM